MHFVFESPSCVVCTSGGWILKNAVNGNTLTVICHISRMVTRSLSHWNKPSECIQERTAETLVGRVASRSPRSMRLSAVGFLIPFARLIRI